MINKIAVRIKPLKKWSDVSNATRHGRREDPAKHVDRSRTHLNEHWTVEATGKELQQSSQPADIELAYKRLSDAAGAKWRKNAIIGTEMLFIASPAFFGPAAGGREEYRVQKAREWARDCLVAAQERYPNQIAAARLDLDETTPHFSVFLIPTYSKAYDGKARKSSREPRLTISHNQTFGTPEALSALQDWAAESMHRAGHNLERGKPKTRAWPDHITPAEGRRRLADLQQIASDKDLVERFRKLALDEWQVAKKQAREWREGQIREADKEAWSYKLDLQQNYKKQAQNEYNEIIAAARFDALTEFNQTRQDPLPANQQKLEQDKKNLTEALLQERQEHDSYIDELRQEHRASIDSSVKKAVQKVERKYTAILELVKSTLKAILPTDLVDKLITKINGDWDKHPDNPDRSAQQPPSSAPPSRRYREPSGP